VHPPEHDDAVAEVAELVGVDTQVVPEAAHVVEVAADPGVALVGQATGRQVRGDRVELDVLVHEVG
jgi:hypothetical protein